MRTALITPVHGRHHHLVRQQEALARSDRPADVRVVVAMADPDVAALLPTDTVVVELDRRTPGLPLAAARNAGAAAALDRGAELLVFLDVDCLPGPELLDRYATAAADPAVASTLLCGPVAYLPAPPAEGYDLTRLADAPTHAARPAPPDGTLQTGGDPRLFWSLSFGVRASTWRRIGGFHEVYHGYGGEDTDFAMTAGQAGIDLTWVGGATAYHQWHPVSAPPVQHLDDILRNGAVFASRWGWWPMEGWLADFAALGLIEPAGPGWVRSTPAHRSSGALTGPG